jgi:hypothetical protein
MSPASSEGTMLAGDISHPPAQMVLFVLAGGYVTRQHRWTQPLEKFEFFKRFQLKKLLT